MTIFFQLLLVGIMAGAVLGLTAMGFILIYRCSGIFNIAQGELVAIGALLCFAFLNGLNLHPALAIFLAMLGGALIGLLLSRFPFGPLTGQPMLALFIVSLGLLVFLRAGILMVWGTRDIGYFRPFLPQGAIDFAGLALYPRELFGFGVAAALLLVFLWLFRFTRFGLVLRAVSEDTRIARSLGINLKVLIAVAFAIGTAVAAVGGVILGLTQGITTNLGDVGLAGLAAVLIGGMESILGGIVGGLLIGVVTAMASYYIGHGFGGVAAYVVMLIILLVRPYGLFGQERIERV